MYGSRRCSAVRGYRCRSKPYGRPDQQPADPCSPGHPFLPPGVRGVTRVFTGRGGSLADSEGCVVDESHQWRCESPVFLVPRSKGPVRQPTWFCLLRRSHQWQPAEDVDGYVRPGYLPADGGLALVSSLLFLTAEDKLPGKACSCSLSLNMSFVLRVADDFLHLQ